MNECSYRVDLIFKHIKKTVFSQNLKKQKLIIIIIILKASYKLTNVFVVIENKNLSTVNVLAFSLLTSWIVLNIARFSSDYPDSAGMSWSFENKYFNKICPKFTRILAKNVIIYCEFAQIHTKFTQISWNQIADRQCIKTELKFKQSSGNRLILPKYADFSVKL
jgi:hypothetical protein